ncbi:MULTISPECIES: bifunctional diguanylate cyclase/phosphodiesterase [unclassified Rhizobium]|uniref:putative bifunctional diguanylate cyclase/phosphodiesterase n=1 Tax=unclassified Rhizobium TaxID=2613769 RepID=UPI00161F6BC0|nr:MULTISPECIES: EAL domain-containing protein [unclassified Rhizobium]MBB3319544.1 diguanylate cyclase (GGDEF)-like protein/PAS domain S-box-containing protein [Rhizobium sp. BK181]MCS4095204.1 diguanylate cyclase (GGDEF)-like protein/PAS domain S-box-containing protein [Rhizobium sp. BK176]
MSARRKIRQEATKPAVPDTNENTKHTQSSDPRERHEWLKAMIDHVPDFIYAKDLEGRFLFANRAVVRNNGFSHVDELVGLTDFDIHPSSFAQEIDEIERQVMTTGLADLGVEEPRLTGDGWLMMTRVPLRDRNGNVIGVVGASRDITSRKRAEELMRAQTQLLQNVARGVEIQSLLQDFIVTLRSLFPSRSVQIVIHGETLDAPSPETLALPIASRDGGRHGSLMISTLADEDAGVLEFLSAVAQTIGIALDRNRDVERIAHLAEHDVLTGLPNRTLLDRTLQRMLTNAVDDDKAVAVAFLDLDNFKLINDSLGHAAGDELLKAVAHRIVREVGEAGLVSRIGGDEFVLILGQTNESFRDRLERLRAAIATSISISGIDLRITASIGVACLERPGVTSSELCANADLALYRAKEAGRDGIQMFTPVMAAEARNKLARIDDLRRAIESDEFVVHYQAQYANTGNVIGVEALVRWNHPTRGVLAPSEFVPLAEETGLIVAIGDIVLNKACQQAKDWQKRSVARVRVAVNVSPRQFLEPSLTSHVSQALADADLDPEWLELEVTESLIMQDVEGAIARMHELKALGVSLSIDDFGTGYSSLSMLKKFPLSRLKIDRSFIADIPNDSEDMAITNAIVSLAKLLRLEVVAEGVETEAQARFLERAGCEVFQGYLFARPLPTVDVERLFDCRLSSKELLPQSAVNSGRAWPRFSPGCGEARSRSHPPVP